MEKKKFFICFQFQNGDSYIYHSLSRRKLLKRYEIFCVVHRGEHFLTSCNFELR